MTTPRPGPHKCHWCGSYTDFDAVAFISTLSAYNASQKLRKRVAPRDPTPQEIEEARLEWLKTQPLRFH